MRITGFIWLADIIEKLSQKHSVNVDEAEAIFRNRPRFRFVERVIVLERMSTRHSDRPMLGGI